MIDQIVAKRSAKKHNVRDALYSPEQAITGRRLFNPQARRLTVIFPPWHGTEQLEGVLKKRTAKQGSSLLLYTLHDHILSDDIGTTIQSFEHIQTKVSDDVEGLQAKHGFDDIHLVGYSLGVVSLAMVAARLRSNFRATCVVGAANLAAAVWEGIRTTGVREGLESQGVVKSQLEDEWSSIAPINNLSNFRDREVQVVISKTDRTIPYIYQEELASGLQQSGADLTINRTSNGHVMSVVAHGLTGEF